MSLLRVIAALAVVLVAGPARAQGVFDDFFGPAPKPKTRAAPAKRPPATKQPAAVQSPAAVPQPNGAQKVPSAATPAAPPAAGTAANPPAPKAPIAKATPAPAAGTPAKPAAVKPVAPTSVAREAPPPAAQKPAVIHPVTPSIQAPSAAPAVTPVPAAKPAAVSPPPAAEPNANSEVARATPPEPQAASPAQTAALTGGPQLPPPPKPANCKNSGNFPGWLAGFRKEASAAGVSSGTISDVLDGMTLDQGIINRDRGGQKVFTQSFVDFSSKLANPSRYNSSVFKFNKHKATFAKAEAEFGVPGQVITAFWALESDFGTGMGNLPILRSLATLAYDCRRGEMFHGELMAALKLIDRGDMRPQEMVGSWAGEIGQTQFLPGHVLNYAVDYDGDGRRDLFRSNADIIGTTANFIRDLGWKAGEPWLQEVRLTKELPWEEADLAIKLPLAKWTGWGVTQVNGTALKDGPPASLVLPMGRRGPAFLAYPNFDVYTKWNQSLVYALTAAHLATRIAGAPPMSRGDPGIPMLDAGQVKELQSLLNQRGWSVGEPDGKLGSGTRAAVKQAQLKFKMPADSYPTAELLGALRSGR